MTKDELQSIKDQFTKIDDKYYLDYNIKNSTFARIVINDDSNDISLYGYILLTDFYTKLPDKTTHDYIIDNFGAIIQKESNGAFKDWYSVCMPIYKDNIKQYTDVAVFVVNRSNKPYCRRVVDIQKYEYFDLEQMKNELNKQTRLIYRCINKFDFTVPDRQVWKQKSNYIKKTV
jgi:hypothetical protein